MNLTDVGTAVLALCAILALIAGIVGWFFKRGGDERVFAVALKDCANAVRELTAEFRGFKDSVVGELHRLDIRVTKLEEAPKHDSTPPDRDAGTPG